MRLQHFLKGQRFTIQRRTYSGKSLAVEARPALKMLCQKKSCRREPLEATGGTKGGHAVDGGSRL